MRYTCYNALPSQAPSCQKNLSNLNSCLDPLSRPAPAFVFLLQTLTFHHIIMSERGLLIRLSINLSYLLFRKSEGREGGRAVDRGGNGDVER